MTDDQRVVVVGAGIAGASAAFGLARRGVRPIVIDDGATGQATAASAGIIQPWSTAAVGPYYQLYADGAAFYPELLQALADAGVTKTDYRRTGGLVVNADPALLAETEQRVRDRLRTAGEVVGTVERIDNAAARELFPPLAPGLEAVFISGGGRVDGRTLRDALLDAAVRMGAQRPTGHAEVDHDGGRPMIMVDGAPVGADAVVLAAGAWTNTVLTKIGITVPVAAQKGQITHLRVDADTTNWPTVHPISHHYLVAFDDSRIAVGATRETGSGFDTRVTAAGQLQVLQDALSVAPGLADATLIETRVGLRPLADDLPIAGAVPGCNGLYVATGYGAGGLTMGPMIGDAIARRLLGEAAPELAAVTPR
ncbi:MAG TPA: FAD-dependent oxidoreductase [Microlunatus sp.]